MKPIIRVVVTGAGGQIGYSILQPLALGLAFGCDQPIHIVLFDIPPAEDVMKGVQIELHDLASPTLMGTSIATSPDVAFKDADFIVCLAGRAPLKEGMTRSELAKTNVPIYTDHGKAIDQFAKKTVKVLVVANPCNTLCLVLKRNAPSIPAENFSSMSRLDQNRARSLIAAKLGVKNTDVKNVCVWGNHASSMVPDFSRSTAIVDGKEAKVTDLIKEIEFWAEFTPTVQERAMAVVRYRKNTSALSSAMAAVNHLRDWFLGTPEGQYSSMGVYSDGSYGAPTDVFFSFPCICKDGKWTIPKDLVLTPEIEDKLKITGEDLVKERTELIPA